MATKFRRAGKAPNSKRASVRRTTSFNAPAQIFKIQRPLYSSDNYMNHILFYNEDRSIQQELYVDIETITSIFLDPDLVALDPENLMELSPYKVFVMASVAQGQLVIEYVLNEEDWPTW